MQVGEDPLASVWVSDRDDTEPFPGFPQSPGFGKDDVTAVDSSLAAWLVAILLSFQDLQIWTPAEVCVEVAAMLTLPEVGNSPLPLYIIS